MSNQPLLSILIPTKNREEYALKVIHQILGITDERFELIIYDNSDENKLENLLFDFFGDSRIKYFYNNKILSFVENFSLGIGKCDGEYITIIGDDDGINPMLIEIADWASQNEIKAITPSLPIIYYWPKSITNSESDNGILRISDFSCKAKFYDSYEEVVKLLKNGCQNYLAFNLAKAYHGLLKKSILDEIRDQTGNYIGGLSPDIYLSVGASLLVKKVLIIDYPLTFSGICKKSGSADSATGKHTGTLAQAPHFRGHLNYEWSHLVPPFYCVETIWADSALAAVKDLKIKNLIKYFNVHVLAAYCIKLYPQFKAIVFDNLAKENHSLLKKFYLFIGFLKGPFIKRIKAISNQLLYKKSTKTFDNISDIKQASEKIQANIKNYDKIMLSKLQSINNT